MWVFMVLYGKCVALKGKQDLGRNELVLFDGEVVCAPHRIRINCPFIP
jgi:hypothetical protein